MEGPGPCKEAGRLLLATTVCRLSSGSKVELEVGLFLIGLGLVARPAEGPNVIFGIEGEVYPSGRDSGDRAIE